jgi:hypothetical protein
MTEQYFPGLEPPPKPGKIVVTRAEPISIEEREGMKDGLSQSSYAKNNQSIRVGRSMQAEPATTTRKEAPTAQASADPVRAHAPAPPAPEKTKRTFQGFRSITVIRLASALISALAALMSWYYSLERFAGKLPSPWLYIMPLIIVGAATLLPQVAIVFLGRKGIKNKAASMFVFCVGLLATSFSMISVIEGLYNSNTRAMQKNAQLVSIVSELELYQGEVRRIDKELDRLNREIDSTQGKIDAIPTEETLKADSQALMRRLNAAKREKGNYETGRKEAVGKIEKIQGSGLVARKDMGSFLGGITGASRDEVEFGLSCAPAILLDIVAPILSAVALFL